MTQEPESKEAKSKSDKQSTTSSAPSTEKKFVQRSLQAIARWSPLGGTSFAFGSFLLKQEWATALALFPVTAISGVWATYSKNFIERLSEIYAERGKKDAEGFVANMDRWNQSFTQAWSEWSKWQFSGFEAKYLQCQRWDCHEDYAVGLKEEEDLPQSNPLLQEVFVPLQLSTDSMEAGYEFRQRGEEYPVMQIWDLLRLVKQKDNYRQIVIRAWGGYGKSTLLKHLAYTYSVRGYGKYRAPKFIPFLLYLADCRKEIIKENPPNLPELLTSYHFKRLPKLSQAKGLEAPPNWALNLLNQGDALVLFDGFDEVPPSERTKVSEWLSWEMQQYRKSVFILTSRPTAYKEDDVARKPSASFWIQDFNREQRKEFVEQWYLCQERHARAERNTPDVGQKAKERAASLLAQIEARPELNDIAGNVLLLNMMARFHRDKQGAELPQRRVELYQDICEMQLGRRPKAKGVTLLLNSISQRQGVLQNLALRMMVRVAKNINDKEGFKQIQRNSLLQLIEMSLSKIDPDVDSEEFLTQMEQVSELLVKRDGSIYQFSHLSFQEFLAAAEIVRLKEEGERLIFKCLGVSTWKDLILFYASLVNPTRIIQEAINRNQTDLAYQIYRQTDKRLNLLPAERKALQGLKEPVKTSRYQKLEEHLKTKQWFEADQEIYRLMITAAGKDEGQWFEPVDLQEFPCDELLAIDRLWVQYSNGLYGFSVQKQIYVECGGKLDFSYPSEKAWDQFCDRIAWKSEGKWVNYPQPFLDNNFINNKGHLPFIFKLYFFKSYEVGLLFSHRDL
ncbi:NTPase (NACHT family) [Tumidithrix helvetica PCC 7403]|uniref:GUN4 domain-containing protein n=1 Tax=Tumidithrix helvetica TaxID=3457545 RepID=UPI003CB5B042